MKQEIFKAFNYYTTTETRIDIHVGLRNLPKFWITDRKCGLEEKHRTAFYFSLKNNNYKMYVYTVVPINKANLTFLIKDC